MRLVLFRHAKSKWPDGVQDIDRPLAQRGINDCMSVAEYFNSQAWQLDLAVVSPAVRTQETFALVSSELSYLVDRVNEARIYEASSPTLLKVVNEQKVETVLLVGHGPGLPELAILLADEVSFEKAAKVSLKYPTSGIAVIESDLPWQQWRARSARLVDFVVPHGHLD